MPPGQRHAPVAEVETKLEACLHPDAVSSLEPGYRIFGALVPKGLPLDVTEAALLRVLENMAAQPVTEAELAWARPTLLKGIELAATDTSSLAVALTESMAAGDWRLFFIQRDRIEELTAAQVRAVALKDFKPSNRTLGRFICAWRRCP